MSRRKRRRHHRTIIPTQGSGPAVLTAEPSKVTFGAMGSPGVRALQGAIYEDYNPDLRAPQKWETYEKMRAHGQVQAVEIAIRLMMQAVEFDLPPVSDSAEDVEAANTVWSNLSEGMLSTWSQVIGEYVLSTLYGLNVLEPVWIRGMDGKERLQDLAPRHPRTISRWDLDSNGRVRGLIQHVQDPQGRWKDIPLSADRLVIMTFRGDGGNPEGMGLFRGAYMHWFMSTILYKIQAIGYERLAIGVPIGKLPPGFTETDKQALLQILRSLRAHESSGIVIPEGYLIEILEGKRSPTDMQPGIDHHVIMIARAFLGQFLNLGGSGSGSTGSWALGDVLVRFFVVAMDGLLAFFRDFMQRDVVDRYCAYRWPNLKVRPKLTCASVQSVLQPAALADVLLKLQQGSYVNPDDDLEDMLRRDLHLTPRPTDETAGDEGDTSSSDERMSDEGDGETSGRRRSNPRTGAARHRQVRPRDNERWDRTQARLSAAKDAFQQDMEAVIKQQHAALKAKVGPIVDAIVSSDDLSRGKQIRKLLDLTVPSVGRYENLVVGWLRNFYQKAIAAAADAASMEPPATIPNAIRTWLSTYGAIIARKHADALRARVQLEAVGVIRRQLPTSRILWNVEQQARKKASLDLHDDLTAAGRELIDLINDALAEIPVESPPEEGDRG
jgi:hypothetical protein